MGIFRFGRCLHSFLECGEVVTILLAVEAGAVFVDTLQLSVATDVCLGVILLQTAQEGDESSPLFRRPRVCNLPLGIIPAFVADADGVGVIPAGMDARHFL